LILQITKHVGLRIVWLARWIASTGVDQANSPVDSRKIQMFPLDHPGRELDDLFGWERLLRVLSQ